MVKSSIGTKLYYSISEVAEITDLQPYTLRAWEKEFACLRPRRARGKNRAYRERDIGIVQLIKQLLYEEGYTTKGVKQKLKNEPELLQTTPFIPPQPDQRCEDDHSTVGDGRSQSDKGVSEQSRSNQPTSATVHDAPDSRDETKSSTPEPPQDQPITIARIKKELKEILELL